MIAFDRSGRIKQLNLCGTKVTAKQLRSIKKQLHGLKEIRALDFSSALMPDSALREISNLRKLRALSLNIRKFQSLLPKCRVQWEGAPTNYRAQQRVQHAYDMLLEKESEVRKFSLRTMQRRLLGVCLCSGEGLEFAE